MPAVQAAANKVRRIFAWLDASASEKKICKSLNRRRIPSHLIGQGLSPGWDRSQAFRIKYVLRFMCVDLQLILGITTLLKLIPGP